MSKHRDPETGEEICNYECRGAWWPCHLGAHHFGPHEHRPMERGESVAANCFVTRNGRLLRLDGHPLPPLP